MNLDAIAGGSEIDEETWLVEPPKTDSSTQSSGHIIEWLQVKNEISFFYFNIRDNFFSLPI